MKNISLEDYKKLKSVRCDKSKHKFRQNSFGVTWCTICGLLSTADAQLLTDNDKLNIICCD